MSFNRENVIWESEDESWNRGFFFVAWTGDDPEWDVEYDYDAFGWASTGHPSERAAHDSWNGANPGGCFVTQFEGNEELCRRYDEMAADCEQPYFW